MTAVPRRVLVVVTRRIGDVLLATPLIRSLARAWPQARIEALVFAGTQGVLAGNPDLAQVLTVPERPTFAQHARLLAALFRRYDLALSLIPGDRPTLYAYLAGRRRIGLLLDRAKDAWKRRLLHDWVPFDDLDTHTVRMPLALAARLGIAPSNDVAVHWTPDDERAVTTLLGDDARPLAVLHVYPKFTYKQWPAAHWQSLARDLAQRGWRLALTGSRDVDERAYIDALARTLPADTVNAAGRLTLGGSACLVSRAYCYVGTDTAMTHVAAALGVPTVALFGPSNPVKWGPWPRGQDVAANPWVKCGTQHRGNVALVQGSPPCVPCLLEGCDRHVRSVSDCLVTLPPARVLAALDRLLQG